jgi:Soluble NSF attachment protein, SNAP
MRPETDPVDRTANSCFKEAADLYAELHDYSRAIHHYELVADASLSSALTKYSVKEYWLRAGLCAVAEGVSALFIFFMPCFAQIDRNTYLLSVIIPILTWTFAPYLPCRIS